MFKTYAESRPEATTAANLVVGGATVMVATQRTSGGDITLSHNQGGDKERVVVMLFMCREDDVATYLATCQCGVVTYNGVVEPQPILQMDMLTK